MGDPSTDFVSMMTLEPHGRDVWVGTGPRYPWGGLYGGQIVAQALRAAAETVEPGFRVHSLHAYFIRRGDHAEPVRYEVDRVRNGRSFATRTVTARQAVGAILSTSVSFQVDEPGQDVQTAAAPAGPTPEELQADSWTTMFDRAMIATGVPGRTMGWAKILGDVDALEDPVLSACAIAYLSDDFPTEAVVSLRRNGPDPLPDLADNDLMAFSLDHALWFHRPVRAADWHQITMTCSGIISSRGLTSGEVFTRDGVHVASISQEVLLRVRR